MAIKQGTIFLLAATGGALFLMSGKKRASRKGAPTGDIDLDEEDAPSDQDQDPVADPVVTPEDYAAAVLEAHTDPNGLAQLGMLYQIKPGDTPLEVCREALFGSRDPVSGPASKAVTDLMVRIDCGPWNQALYGVPLTELNEGHADIDDYFTQRGVSFHPIYQDNRQRILEGMRPTSEPGIHLALIWIPMINLERLDIDGVVTTEGMNWEDSETGGIGNSMIDPPAEIQAFEFEEVSADEVGCDLPEGDFRRTIYTN